MRKIIYGILPVLLLLGSCTGCVKWPEPAILNEAPYPIPKTEVKKKEAEYHSMSCANLGWSDLKKNYVSSQDVYYLKSAGELFNWAWKADTKNYYTYWGWGVIRGYQSEFAEKPSQAETYLKQSIQFLKLAKKYDVSHKDQCNIDLDLDLANAYNGLGAFYLKVNNNTESTKALDSGEKLISTVLQQAPKNGRAYFLLSVNFYYRQNYHEAKVNADNAQKYQFKVSPDYLKELHSR